MHVIFMTYETLHDAHVQLFERVCDDDFIEINDDLYQSIVDDITFTFE